MTRFKEENPEPRVAGRELIVEAKAVGPKRRTFAFVGTRVMAAGGGREQAVLG